MTPATAAIYTIPPLLCMVLALRAKNRFVRTLLLGLGIGCLVLFAVTAAPNLDCTYADYTYQNCQVLPTWAAHSLGTLLGFFTLFYLFAAPVLLVIAAVAEMVTRSK